MSPDVSLMTDTRMMKGISAVTTQLRAEGKPVKARINRLITLNL